MPVVRFTPETTICSFCGEQLAVRKSRGKTVFTLHIGGFSSIETLRECHHETCSNDQHYGSEALSKLVPHLCNYGYDVMVYIGKAMFLRHRQGPEIREELAEKNVPISVNEVYYLAEKFIVYLAALHHIRTVQIREVMNENGGYILHLDTFGDKDSPRIITGIDAISNFILDNAKIASEKCDYVCPFLTQILERYGHPIAVVQDMGKGLMNAVEKVFSGVTVFICHFHFLRDLGKDLLHDNYDILRKRLRHHGILTHLRTLAKSMKACVDEHIEFAEEFTMACGKRQSVAESRDVLLTFSVYTIIQWILEGKKLGNGYGFPFDRQHLDFAVRLIDAAPHIHTMKTMAVNTTCGGYKTLLKLDKHVLEITEDEELTRAIHAIQKDITVFDKLRKALRIAPEEGKDGLNDDGGEEDIGSIERRVSKFREWLVDTEDGKDNERYEAFIRQLDKYWDKLFADPIEVSTSHGKILIQPQRTNNILEQLFRNFKHWYRRKSGYGTMGKTLRAMVTNTPLVRNLRNEEYVRVILGGNATLEEAFAEIDSDLIRKNMKEATHSPDKIPDKIKTLIKKPNLPELLSRFLT